MFNFSSYMKIPSKSIKEFTKENNNNSNVHKSSSKCGLKPILAVKPTIRPNNLDTNKTKQIESREKFTKTNAINNHLFAINDSLKFRISSNKYKKITEHENEISAVKRKIAEVSPFVEEKPLDLRIKIKTKVNFHPTKLINHECSKVNQLGFSMEFGNG